MSAMSINWKKIMRRTACLICAVCILLSGVGNEAWTEEAAQYETIEVSEGTLATNMLTNVRRGPGTEYGIIAGMKAGETCVVLGEENGWYQVEFNGLEGYISKDLLTVRTYETQVPKVVETPVPTAMPGYELMEVLFGEIVTDLTVNVNVRAGAGKEHAVVMELAPGETCRVLEEGEEWCRIAFGAVEGYVVRDVLNITRQLIQVPTATAEPGYEWVQVSVGTMTAQTEIDVRAGAGAEYEVVGSMQPGETCAVLDAVNGWRLIEFGEQAGWIAEEHIEIGIQMTQQPLPTETPEPTAAQESTDEPEVTRSPEPGYEWVQVSVGTLIAQATTNIRAGAGTEHGIIGSMKPGETCEVLGEEKGWYRIEFGGLTGWISGEYIEISIQITQKPLATETPEPTATPEMTETPEPTAEATELPEAEPGYEWVQVSVGTLIAQTRTNVRAGAGTEHDIIDQMQPGETCKVLGEENGWSRIEYKEKEGWISSEYIEISVQITQKPLATETPELTATPEMTETPEPTAEATELPEAEPGYEWTEVSVGTLIAQVKTNIRAGAGTEYEIVGYMKPDQTCVVLDEESDWYRIDFEGQIGWISGEYIEISRQVMQRPLPTATPEPTETPVPAETSMPGHELREAKVGTVTAEASASFRTGPGANYAIIDYIAPGKYCIVLDDEMEWYEVRYNGQVGYVAKEYLTVEKKVTQVPLATATPAPTQEPTAEPTAAGDYEMREMQVGTVVAEAVVNVRAGAGTEHGIVANLAPGETCIVLGEENGWCFVEMSGLTGYISKDLLEISMQMVAVPAATEVPQITPVPTAAPGYEMVEVIEGTLSTQQSTNIRKGPGTDFGIITQMKPGEVCMVLGEEGDWYRIQYAGQKGYIMKEFLQTRSYMEQREIIEEDPLDAYVVGFDMPRTMARRGSVVMEGAVEANIPMTEISVTVYDLRNMVEEMSASAAFTREAGVKSFDLMNLDGDLRFSRLDAGEKRITITVSSTNEQKVVYETDFYVLGECSEPAGVTEQCSFTSRASRADRAVDGRWSTAWEPTAAGDEMMISVPAGVVSETLTLEWTKVPAAFEVLLDGESAKVENLEGMISFAIKTGGASEIVIRVSDAAAGICEARVYSEGRTPEVVHDWQSASGNVDMMVVVTHPGDEFLFFGGAVPLAAAEGKEVLVVYMTDCGRERYAEAMDGLWAVGVRTHPVCLNLENGRAKEYEDAIDMWGLEETYEILVEVLRKYKPDVVLTHDIYGEDEDNQHKLTSAALRRAVLLATDAGAYPESSAQYGVWDVKKTYIHRYEGNVLTLDADTPMALMNGWTLREMTTVGFNKNRELMESFDLEDGEEYDPYSYGMIRAADGMAEDVLKNSFFENIEENVE